MDRTRTKALERPLGRMLRGLGLVAALTLTPASAQEVPGDASSMAVPPSVDVSPAQEVSPFQAPPPAETFSAPQPVATGPLFGGVGEEQPSGLGLEDFSGGGQDSEGVAQDPGLAPSPASSVSPVALGGGTTQEDVPVYLQGFSNSLFGRDPRSIRENMPQPINYYSEYAAKNLPAELRNRRIPNNCQGSAQCLDNVFTAVKSGGAGGGQSDMTKALLKLQATKGMSMRELTSGGDTPDQQVAERAHQYAIAEYAPDVSEGSHGKSNGEVHEWIEKRLKNKENAHVAIPKAGPDGRGVVLHRVVIYDAQLQQNQPRGRLPVTRYLTADPGTGHSQIFFDPTPTRGYPDGRFLTRDGRVMTNAMGKGSQLRYYDKWHAGSPESGPSREGREAMKDLNKRKKALPQPTGPAS